MTQAGIYKELSTAVAESKSEASQVNGVARVLAALGYKKAATPEVHQTNVERSTFRIYLWRDSPFGDHLILATGPSFTPKLALASEVPATAGVGFYIHALVAKDVKALSGASRAAERGAASVSASEARASASDAASAKRRAESDARATKRHREEAEDAAKRAADNDRRTREAAESTALRRGQLDAARLAGRERARGDTARQAEAARSRVPSQAEREAALQAKLLALLG